MDWITANGNQVSVVILLLVAVYALWKEYVVPGTTHRKVVQERDDALAELKKQNTTLLDQNIILKDLVSYIKSNPPEVKS